MHYLVSEFQQILRVHIAKILNRVRSALVGRVFLSPQGPSASVGTGLIHVSQLLRRRV